MATRKGQAQRSRHAPEQTVEGDKEKLERKRERNRRWYQRNRETRHLYQKAWRKTLSGRYSELRNEARRRSVQIDLTLEQFSSLLKDLRCHYCDADISDQGGASLDRKNSSLGYTLANCVPCCFECNTRKKEKSYKMFVDELDTQVRKSTLRNIAEALASSDGSY